MDPKRSTVDTKLLEICREEIGYLLTIPSISNSKQPVPPNPFITTAPFSQTPPQNGNAHQAYSDYSTIRL